MRIFINICALTAHLSHFYVPACLYPQVFDFVLPQEELGSALEVCETRTGAFRARGFPAALQTSQGDAGIDLSEEPRLIRAEVRRGQRCPGAGTGVQGARPGNLEAPPDTRP